MKNTGTKPNNLNVDAYLAEGCGRCPLGGTAACKVNTWRKELETLRAIVLNCGLVEELKWGVPCYTFDGNNIILLAAFKECCTISFLKGALLQDKNSILSKPGKNTQAARIVRFESVDEIIGIEAVLKSYIYAAIEIEKVGLKVNLKKITDFDVPEELQHKFEEMPALKTAFESLTPGRQRAYFLHISTPKQAQTRMARVEKCMAQILSGKGLNE